MCCLLSISHVCLFDWFYLSWCGQWSAYYLITELNCIFCTLHLQFKHNRNWKNGDRTGYRTSRNKSEWANDNDNKKWKKLYFHWMQPKHNNFSEFVKFKRWKLMMIKPKNTIKSEQRINLNNWQLHIYQFIFDYYYYLCFNLYVLWTSNLCSHNK